MTNRQTQQERIKEWLERFTDEQLESLYHHGSMLEKAFSDPRGPAGHVISGWMRMEEKVTGERTMVFRLPVRWEMYNRLGILHGGVLATLVDNAMGKGLHTLYPGKIVRQVTVNLNIHYLKGAVGKELLAHTTLVQAGKSLAVMEATVTDENENVVCLATGTFRIYTKS